MCLPMPETELVDWLKRQVLVIEAWREDMAMKTEIDMDDVMRLERHYAWLTTEIARLEADRSVRAA